MTCCTHAPPASPALTPFSGASTLNSTICQLSGTYAFIYTRRQTRRDARWQREVTWMSARGSFSPAQNTRFTGHMGIFYIWPCHFFLLILFKCGRSWSQHTFYVWGKLNCSKYVQKCLRVCFKEKEGSNNSRYRWNNHGVITTDEQPFHHSSDSQYFQQFTSLGCKNRVFLVCRRLVLRIHFKQPGMHS